MKIDALKVSGACVVFAIYACSSDEPPTGAAAPPSTADAGTSNDAASDAGSASKPAFLEAAEYADFVTLDPKFPYGVTQKHAADAKISGSHWGRDGGPMVTVGDAVVHWTLPTDAKADATASSKPFVEATGLPDGVFYGADGMVDLPFGSLSMLNYTGPDKPYPGEALIYDATYQTVKSRAKANGFYSGAGIANGGDGLLVYSALSALAAADSENEDSGLYVTGICGEKLLAPAPCPESRKLFDWTGNSGPVVTDAHGNAFVGASVTGAATSDTVYGLGKTEITSGAAVEKRVIAAVDSGGTASLAALAPEGDASGWVLGLGFADTSPIYAAPYVENAGAVVAKGDVVTSAITRATGVDAISVFADADGDLWLAVVKGDKGTYLELRRR
jgi:hypothetical protein